jgi:hypothetical protein
LSKDPFSAAFSAITHLAERVHSVPPLLIQTVAAAFLEYSLDGDSASLYAPPHTHFTAIAWSSIVDFDPTTGQGMLSKFAFLFRSDDVLAHCALLFLMDVSRESPIPAFGLVLVDAIASNEPLEVHFSVIGMTDKPPPVQQGAVPRELQFVAVQIHCHPLVH